jgi:hypothetical protein
MIGLFYFLLVGMFGILRNISSNPQRILFGFWIDSSEVKRNEETIK